MFYRTFHFLHLASFSLLLCGVLANDVILGGIFAEHFSGSGAESPCGELNQRAAVDKVAMEFAIREINASAAILPGISLAVNMKDSCSNLDHAISNTLNYEFVKRKLLNSTVACSPRLEANECCVEHAGGATDAPLVAIIAGGDSHIVKAIVNLVGVFKVPVIGYSSTSPSLNKIDYFLRTVPSDAVTAQVLLDLFSKHRWNMVLVVYADTEFGHYAADSFRTAIRRVDAKVCIAYEGKFSRTSGIQEVGKIADGIRRAKMSHVVAFFGTVEDFVFFAEKSKASNFNMNNYMWITSEIWPRPDLVRMPVKVTNVLSLIPEQSFALDRFYDYLRSRGDVNLTCLPTSQNTTLHFHGSETNRRRMGLSDQSGGNCSLAHSMSIPHVLDAVYAVAMALHNMLGCEVGKSCRENLKKIKDRSLLKHLKDSNFTNPLTNTTVSFDDNGNPHTTHYTAVNLEVGNNCYKFTLVGHWLCQHNTTACKGDLINKSIDNSFFNSTCGTPCAKGEYKSVKEEFPDCCWQCERCSGNKYTNASDRLGCFECPNDRWPSANHTACEKIHPEYLHMNSVAGILIFAWDSVGIVSSVLVGVVFLKYSSSHIVRASSRQLSLLLLLGILLDYSLLIFLLTEPSRIQCTIIFLLSHVISCLLTGTLFIKTNRIHRIFRKSAMKARPRCMGNVCQLFIILVLVLIEITLGTLNLFFYPETGHVKVTYLQKGDSKKAFVLCNFFGNSFQKGLLDALLWSYSCGLIFICTYQAYLVRKVPENYNEARYITFTMVTVSMTIIVYVITDSGMEGYNLEVVYCIFQSVRASVALVCMFFPKVYIILVQPEKNVPHNPVQSQLGVFVEDERLSKVVPVAGEVLNDSSLSGPSESSADSNTNCPTRRAVRLHRKVGAVIESNNDSETTLNRACSVHRHQEDLNSEPMNVVENLEKGVNWTGESFDSSIHSQSTGTVIISGLSDSSTTA